MKHRKHITGPQSSIKRTESHSSFSAGLGAVCMEAYLCVCANRRARVCKRVSARMCPCVQSSFASVWPSLCISSYKRVCVCVQHVLPLRKALLMVWMDLVLIVCGAFLGLSVSSFLCLTQRFCAVRLCGFSKQFGESCCLSWQLKAPELYNSKREGGCL